MRDFTRKTGHFRQFAPRLSNHRIRCNCPPHAYRESHLRVRFAAEARGAGCRRCNATKDACSIWLQDRLGRTAIRRLPARTPSRMSGQRRLSRRADPRGRGCGIRQVAPQPQFSAQTTGNPSEPAVRNCRLTTRTRSGRRNALHRGRAKRTAHRRNSRQVPLRCRSSAENGSSKSSRSGFPTSIRASAVRCC